MGVFLRAATPASQAAARVSASGRRDERHAARGRHQAVPARAATTAGSRRRPRRRVSSSTPSIFATSARTPRCGRRSCASCARARCRRRACRTPTARRSRACSRGSSAASTRRRATPNPGRPVLHRLNRTEYRNAIRDLLALDIGDVASLLPPDDSAYGFDTIADFLGVSQVLLERYLSAAGRISALAVGDAGRRARLRDLSGAPGSVAGQAPRRHAVRHRRRRHGQPHVPGRRRVRAPGDALSHQRGPDPRPRAPAPARDRPSTASACSSQTIGGTPPGNPGGADEAATGRGRLLSRSDAIDARLQVRVHVKAGPRAVTVAFLQRSRARGSAQDAAVPQLVRHLRRDRRAAHRDAGREGTVQRGRRRATRPSRARVFTCRPATRGAGRAVRAADSLDAGAPRLPAAGLGRRRERATMEFYRAGRKEGQLRVGHPAGAAAHSGQPEVRASRRARSRHGAGRHRLSRSATSSWPRGCRSSCGAASRTTSC